MVCWFVYLLSEQKGMLYVWPNPVRNVKFNVIPMQCIICVKEAENIYCLGAIYLFYGTILNEYRVDPSKNQVKTDGLKFEN